MTIIPPDELIPYISINDNGEWIHDPDMPKELETAYEKFVNDEAATRKKMKEGQLQ